jgi:hypothetical protein
MQPETVLVYARGMTGGRGTILLEEPGPQLRKWNPRLCAGPHKRGIAGGSAQAISGSCLPQRGDLPIISRICASQPCVRRRQTPLKKCAELNYYHLDPPGLPVASIQKKSQQLD